MGKFLTKAVCILILFTVILALNNSWRLVTPAVAWPYTLMGQNEVPDDFRQLPADILHEKGRTGVQVMTYNIHHGKGLSGELDLEKIAAVIKASKADIVGLQEVDRNFGERSNFQDQPELLAHYLGMHYVYGESLKVRHLRPGRGVGYYGNLLLSRYPILESEVLRLPNRLGNEPRTALRAVVDIPNIGPTAVWVTHLGLSAVEREAQAKRLLEAIEKESLPSLLMGDFNALAGSIEIRTLKAQLEDVASTFGLEGLGTFYGDPAKPRPRIDYIWTDQDLKAESYEVISSKASDHLPVTARLVVSSKSKEVQTIKGRGE
ncbi:MAG: hypothetical protein GX316_02200 [Firmicutes bacterium]|nr:hypothetical protein [Bacillota bacterium]